ncbi:MAG: protein translocase subunit SecD [Trueperaceae bacterium]|nr:protein translocase subunit SecD [Trueperaceae bacterium]
MNRRNVTGVLVLIAIAAAILYLWQPWQQDRTLKLGLDLQGGLRVVLQADEANVDREELDTARNVIENRVNQFGVSEPVVQTSGDNRIVVELPGLSAADQDRALGLIGQQAVLEFRLVRQASQNKSVGDPNNPLTLDDLEEPAFTGEILQDARADFNRMGGTTLSGAVVLFDIKREFADDFGQFTAGNIGRRMAIVLDGAIQTAPTINGRISDSGQIEGIGTLEEASDIALVLRSGSLPINLNVEEIRAIGPTLGRDSINSGARAGIIGIIAVVVTILLYYGPLFGGVLTLGLILAVLFIFGALAGLNAVLTLPGLAGLVLTIGAAVDGNVISFERIKEELRAGKALRMAMRSGFDNSLSAIIDANVTTLLAAAALYQYTSGPVRGFAVTLAIGIIASVFVNIIVVPFLLDVLTLRIKRPLIPMGFYASGIRFIKIAPVVMAISGLLALIALILVFVKPLNLSVDFTGGTTALYQVDNATDINAIRGAIDSLGIADINGGGALIQEVQDTTISNANTDEAASAQKLYSVRVGSSSTEGANDTFPTDLAAALNANLLSADFVGPSIGSDLRQGAFYAVLVAFGLILVYVGWRFWPNWIVAIAAVIASIHDVGIVMGFLDLIGTQFSIPVLAALLFVVGYSLNDSIIIADRIRENLRKLKGLSYAEIVERSVNQTLSRTIMTSGTTLLPVLALFFFGGSVLRGFSLALLIGIGFGTYSSIFILAPMVVWFKGRQQESKGRRSGRRRTT